MSTFGTAAAALTKYETEVNAQLASIDDNEQITNVLQSIDRLAAIKQAGGSSIASNTAIEFGAGVTTAKTQRVVVANDANTVIRATSAAQTRTSGTTPYSIFDSYGGIGILTGLVSGGSYVLQSFELAIDITAIPSGMALSVMFFDSQSAAQSGGSFIADNTLMTNVIPNSFADSRGIPLSLSVVAGKVIAHTGRINTLIKLASGQTSIHFYVMATAAFISAANSETMSGKSVLGTYSG